MKKFHKDFPSNTFVLALEQDTTNIYPKCELFYIITTMSVQTHTLVLLRKIDISSDPNITYLPITVDQKFSWISKLQAELTKSRNVVLVSERQPYCGLLGKKHVKVIESNIRKSMGTKDLSAIQPLF